MRQLKKIQWRRPLPSERSSIHPGPVTAGHSSILFFFFQAEDGIRDPLVTGVQTCALPISPRMLKCMSKRCSTISRALPTTPSTKTDRKSTRLNSSHEWISYDVFCLKKKTLQQLITMRSIHPLLHILLPNPLFLFLLPPNLPCALSSLPFFF